MRSDARDGVWAATVQCLVWKQTEQVHVLINGSSDTGNAGILFVADKSKRTMQRCAVTTVKRDGVKEQRQNA